MLVKFLSSGLASNSGAGLTHLTVQRV